MEACRPALGALTAHISREANQALPDVLLVMDTSAITGLPDHQRLEAIAWWTGSVDALPIYPRWVYNVPMPLFEYARSECGRTNEHLVRAPAPDAAAPCGRPTESQGDQT
jgi:hypothetical protein